MLPVDGSIKITGSIVSASGQPIEGCTLVLDYAEGVKHPRDEEVPSTFDTGFTISPSKEKYFVSISCPGYTQPYRSKPFYHNGSFDKPPVNLGVIVMKR